MIFIYLKNLQLKIITINSSVKHKSKEIYYQNISQSFTRDYKLHKQKNIIHFIVALYKLLNVFLNLKPLKLIIKPVSRIVFILNSNYCICATSFCKCIYIERVYFFMCDSI